jgi:hypothetical protein
VHSLFRAVCLWASCRTYLFEGVASVSGSFWYDKFTEWFSTQEYNEGNHFGPLIERIEKGIRSILSEL